MNDTNPNQRKVNNYNPQSKNKITFGEMTSIFRNNQEEPYKRKDLSDRPVLP